MAAPALSRHERVATPPWLELAGSPAREAWCIWLVRHGFDPALVPDGAQIVADDVCRHVDVLVIVPDDDGLPVADADGRTVVAWRRVHLEAPALPFPAFPDGDPDA